MTTVQQQIGICGLGLDIVGRKGVKLGMAVVGRPIALGGFGSNCKPGWGQVL